MFRIVEARNAGLNIRQFTDRGAAHRAQAAARAVRHPARCTSRASAFRSPSRAPIRQRAPSPSPCRPWAKPPHLLNCLEAGDSILDIVGPLGHPSEIKNYGTAVILAGSVGTAMALPTAKALKDAGNHVIFIEGARNRDLVVFEDEVRAASQEAYILTDDGSYGEQGLVTKKLEELLAAGRKLDFVLAVGPVPMMRAVARITAPLGIKTMVSLNSIMVDGTGMCGGCRVLLGNQSKFACVDGPGVRRLAGELRSADAAQRHVSRPGVPVAEAIRAAQAGRAGRVARRAEHEGKGDSAIARQARRARPEQDANTRRAWRGEAHA